jgi:hypothetical protein
MIRDAPLAGRARAAIHHEDTKATKDSLGCPGLTSNIEAFRAHPHNPVEIIPTRHQAMRGNGKASFMAFVSSW